MISYKVCTESKKINKVWITIAEYLEWFYSAIDTVNIFILKCNYINKLI